MGPEAIEAAAQRPQNNQKPHHNQACMHLLGTLPCSNNARAVAIQSLGPHMQNTVVSAGKEPTQSKSCCDENDRMLPDVTPSSADAESWLAKNVTVKEAECLRCNSMRSSCMQMSCSFFEKDRMMKRDLFDGLLRAAEAI